MSIRRGKETFSEIISLTSVLKILRAGRTQFKILTEKVLILKTDLGWGNSIGFVFKIITGFHKHCGIVSFTSYFVVFLLKNAKNEPRKRRDRTADCLVFKDVICHWNGVFVLIKGIFEK